MSRTIQFFATFTALLLMAGCASTFEASYDHDSDNDFSGYKTFAWIGKNPMKVGPTTRTVNPLLEGRIMASVEKGLSAKGFSMIADPEKADFALSFTVGSREEIRVDQYPSMTAGYYGSGYPGHWGWGSGYYGVATDTQVRQYTEGMLAIDIFDVSDRRPVWHGVATKRINDSDRKDLDATVDAAVSAIMEGFPPPTAQ